MKKYFISAFIIIIIILCFILIRNCNKGSNQEGLTQITVAHWGQSKILIYLPLYVAMDGGFLNREGLNAKIKFSGNDDQVFATVLSGDAQFGVGDPAFTVISREKGGQGKVLATLVGGLANWGVSVKGKLKQITNYNELEGLRISSFPSPSTTFTLLSEIIQTNNLKNTKIVQTPFGNELALLDKGEVDLAIMLEPNTSIAVSRGNEVVLDLAKMYGPFTLTGVTATDAYIEKNPEVVKKFINGLQNALNLCHSDIDSTIKIAINNFPELNKDVVANAVKRMVQDNVIPRNVQIDSIAWQKLLEIRLKVGDIKSLENAKDALLYLK